MDKFNNTSTEKIQTDTFTDNARYVRITVTGLPSGTSASLYDLKVFGDPDNLALGKTVSSDSALPGNPASYGNDGLTTTRWDAADGEPGHWWILDLGRVMSITDTQVMWEKSGTSYNYKIATSQDNTNWSEKISKHNSGNTNQVQSDYFKSNARYVKITVHGTYSAGTEFGLPSDATASFYEFKVFGTADGPTFHSDANYGGNAVTLDVGNYTLSQMQAAGITDNSISSIQVPADYKVVAYSDDGFSGTSWTFTSDTPSLSGNDNAISSIQVMTIGIVSGATYKIKNKDTGKYLDTDANGAVILASGTTYDDQKWVVTKQSSGYWTINNVVTGREYLNTDPDNIVTWNTGGGIYDDALWDIEPISGEFYSFRVNNKVADREYLHATTANEARWNTGSTDSSTIWVFEKQ